MRGDSQGFSLVELLVAMAVLGLAVLAVIRLGAANLVTAGRTETALLGDIVAENAIVETLSSPQPPALGRRVESVINGATRWQVQRLVERTGDPRIIRISVIVRDGDGEPAGSLTAFRGLQ